MSYSSLADCVRDLEKNGMLVRIPNLVDPHLEMAAIHRRVYEAGGPAIFFEKVKGSPFPAVSNLFGTLERARFIFRHSLDGVKALVLAKANPGEVLSNPGLWFRLFGAGVSAPPVPAWFSKPVLFSETSISSLPQIQCWPNDGGAYITLPQVYSEDCDRPGPLKSNLGMYRVQLSGNDFLPDKEIGLHYQIHRGIGIHQTKSNQRGLPLKVSIFVGGPPAHSLAAVMPLPEGLPEVAFAGALAGRNFRHLRKDGFLLSTEADFVITGTIHPGENKPEGPFGDHLGYYSLRHDFPLMRVHKVWHRKNAIWPFTVVHRPPAEDTVFGELIHEIAGPMIPVSLPGVREVHAVDAAGVHPLLLAIGSERYTPYSPVQQPQEILTQANAILGFNQMSLAKYLLIISGNDEKVPDIHDIQAFFVHLLERFNPKRDLHFQTKTTMDTLDYSGTGLNSGSKVIIAACGSPVRSLDSHVPSSLRLPELFHRPEVALPGVLVIQGSRYSDGKDLAILCRELENQTHILEGFPLIVVADDSAFTAKSLNNFLWVTFTRSNPSHDLHGVGAFTEHKHWGCSGPVIIDARKKPHHAPELQTDEAVEKKVDQLGKEGGPLYGLI